MKVKPQTWQTIKIVLINWTLFVLIAQAFFCWQLYKANKENAKRLDICVTNFGEMERQVESGRIVLDFEK